MKTIFLPTIYGMNSEGRTFKGVIYFELMLTADGPRVIEYNARFGDPEAQAILPMLSTDLLDIFEAIVDERLNEIDIKWNLGSSCCVVMASAGYPGTYKKGNKIHGLENFPDNITVFHAGTKLDHGTYYTNGGRVLGVTALGSTLPEAVARAYDGVRKITWDGAHYRTDIGKR